MPGRVNNARFQQVARSKFGIKGDNPVPDVGDVVPVAIMEDYRVEDYFVGGDDLGFTTFASIGAVAAETGYAVVWNPPNSGVLGIVEGIGAVVAGNAGLIFATLTDPAGNAGFSQSNMFCRDFRAAKTLAQISTVIALQFWSGTLTAAEEAAYSKVTVRFPPNGTATFFPWLMNEYFIVPPGFGLGFSVNVANTLGQIQFSGRQHLQPQGLRT